ncbi:hypothetical protein BC937DRAFT_94878 [Endogone sp. FLAS-F59071]|nr:hypothetical protein BC937DRAFT_94878 [Endogone sp. FLAS-F59071]|eukprot:RUS20586.1 hypothetical protein BC937DRAFT_94878 [Endogone sp. FLAS-F59071]
MALPSNPLKEINILLMGETGVGKSTFINAFVNYLNYNKLEDVNLENLICLIPTTFTISDENFDPQDISIGGNDDNEKNEAGQSATQSCKSYVFPFGSQLIRLIDTPGMGDTRGIDQDAKNFQDILMSISNYTEIHGICILLKPNNSRLTATFHFCIKELLCHLHKSASENIVFLFTNSRGTFYRPGDTSKVLRKMLEDIRNKEPNVEIQFNKDNTFCFDNEAFRFMVALLRGIEFNEEEKENFSKSWDKSARQCGELISYISSLEPHKVQDTLSVNEVRNMIIILAKPLADISENILRNLFVLGEHKSKIKLSIDNISELQNNLYIPVIGFETIFLDKPQTVCASPSCYTIHVYRGQRQVDYITKCHSPCHLTSVTADVIGQPQLLRCTAMDSGICTKCKCSWRVHMHVLYNLKHISDKTIDKNIHNQIQSKQEAKEKAESMVKELDQRCEQLKKEQVVITKTCAKFGHFLKHNAITPYNDSLKEYLDHLIQVQKSLNESGSKNKETIIGLEKMKESYVQELKILDKVMSPNLEIPQPITPTSISEMVDDLYNLKIYGPNIKELVHKLKEAKIKEHFERREYIYQPPSNTWYVTTLYQDYGALAMGILLMKLRALLSSAYL